MEPIDSIGSPEDSLQEATCSYVRCPVCEQEVPAPSMPRLADIDCQRCGFFRPSLEVRMAALKTKHVRSKERVANLQRECKLKEEAAKDEHNN